MTGKEFFGAVANGRVDMVELLLELLRNAEAAYAVLGGLAVNAYAEPVVSLDLDLVVVADRIDAVVATAEGRGMKVERIPHGVNLSMTGSNVHPEGGPDLRIWYTAFEIWMSWTATPVRSATVIWESVVRRSAGSAMTLPSSRTSPSCNTPALSA